jgi:diacylglycerol kinase family enzyme
LYALKSFFTKDLNKQPFIDSISCKKADISVLPPQETQIDGEYIGAKDTVSVQILAQKLEVLTVK